MSKFYVKPNALKATSEQAKKLSNRIDSLSDKAECIMNNLALGISSRQQLCNRLNSAIDETRSIANVVANMGKVASNVSDLYSNAEQRIYKNAGGGAVPISKSKSKQKNGWDIWEKLKSYIDEGGIVGKGTNISIGWASELITGNHGTSTLSNIKATWSFGWDIKDLVKNLKNAKVGKGHKIDWADELFDAGGAVKGIAKCKSLSAGQKAHQAAASVWKHEIRDLDKVKGKGTLLLSAVTNAVDNFGEEYAEGIKKGDFKSLKRAAVETVAETGVEWVKDVFIGSAIAAGFAAAGVAAPAVAVGAATVAVSVGADAVCKWATSNLIGEEKAITEFVSDTLLDTSNAIIKNGAKIIKSSAKATWSGLTNGLKNLNFKYT